ncbi:MAG: histidine kinase [Burkholderiales bacterium]|nr:MAG: histidine kinase [Burkholderiales bacterium]
MMNAPRPGNEVERLRALRSLLLLDTPPEERFDRIAAFAASEFNVPIAVVSLVDEDRQWFKARVGLTVCETSRDVSFCGHAIMAPATMVVPDARRDPRFADNPLVTGEPHICFYAGAPLSLPNGELVGTLCIMDTQPRQMDRTDLAILGALRALVTEELQRREVVS